VSCPPKRSDGHEDSSGPDNSLARCTRIHSSQFRHSASPGRKNRGNDAEQRCRAAMEATSGE
jgi:hypothetical protein